MASEAVASQIPDDVGEPSSADVLELDDPRAMRALAHGVRLAILEFLHAHGTATATECGREVAESPQACSYHLRALAKYGFVRRAPSDDARETRWALAAREIRLTPDATSSPATAAASNLLAQQVLQRDERAIAAFLERQESLPREWREAAIVSSGSIYATPDELKRLERQLRELLRPLARPRRADRPAEARRVRFAVRAVPHVDGKGEDA